MKRIKQLIMFYIVISSFLCGFPAVGSESHLLKAKASDIGGKPLAGVKLFLYDTPNVRRPADFISNLSDTAGKMELNLPPAKYWGVARFKADGKYGPLLPGDKHSGEPVEIDMTDALVSADFVIADIMELGQKKRASATDALRLKGRILDSKGSPVANCYVFANRGKDFTEMPDFISAWTDADGIYEIYLPPEGAYYLAASREFPLRNDASVSKMVAVEYGKIDIAIDIDFTVE